MKTKKLFFATGVLVLLLLPALGVFAEPQESATPSLEEEADLQFVSYIPYKRATTDEETDETRASSYWDQLPNECERFVIVESGSQGTSRFRRLRVRRSKEDTQRTKALIGLVNEEMGGDRNGELLLRLIARHESHANPYALHLLNPDQAANRRAHASYTYTSEREGALEEALATESPRTDRYWKIKRALTKIRRYKTNPYWTANVDYEHRFSAQTKGAQIHVENRQHSAWGFGYGLFGMNAVLYTSVLSPEAPPWALCVDEGIPAIVTAVWALRVHQVQCRALSERDPHQYGDDGESVRGLVHRWGRGHCGDQVPGKGWQALMGIQQRRDRDFGWDTVPVFGSRYSREQADPIVVIEHMKARAVEEGLLKAPRDDAPVL